MLPPEVIANAREQARVAIGSKLGASILGSGVQGGAPRGVGSPGSAPGGSGNEGRYSPETGP